MGKLITIFTFVNCPVTKKRTCRFAIDNNFFPSTYWTARYHVISQTKSNGQNCLHMQKFPNIYAAYKLDTSYNLD